MTDTNIDSKYHVVRGDLEIAFTDELTEEEITAKIDALVDRARENGIDVIEDEVWDVIDDRAANAEDPATYSWVHRSKFRKLELHDRCFPWTNDEELRDAVSKLPSSTPRPEWETGGEP